MERTIKPSRLWGAVEYTAYISAEPTPNPTSVLDMTLNHLPLLPGPLWSAVVAPDRVLSMGRIEQTMCQQMIDVKLWLLDNNTWNHLTVCKKELRLV